MQPQSGVPVDTTFRVAIVQNLMKKQLQTMKEFHLVDEVKCCPSAPPVVADKAFMRMVMYPREHG